MPHTQEPFNNRILERLAAIGDSLAATGQAYALLGLGSVGQETARLDAYSDLDFFAIVREGYKARFIQNLDWLEAAHPLVYSFRNTADGYKTLYADGIFCEFAVFEPHELAAIPFAAPRIVWQHPDFDATVCAPRHLPAPPQPRDMAWLVNEALTNLYIGMGRYCRGEKLSAARFIQHYAVDRILELAPLLETEQPALRDNFGPERRFEQRYPGVAALLPDFVAGYAHSPEATLAILRFLEQHFTINAALKAQILTLCAASQTQDS